MYAPFREFLNKLAPFTESDFNQLESGLILKRVRKRQFLLRQGEVCNHVVWIQQGCLRLFLVDHKATEHVISFAFENETLMERISFVQGTPSNYQIDALEDSIVVLIPKESINASIAEIPSFERIVRDGADLQLIAHQLRITAKLTMNAEEKYETLKQLNPRLMDRIPKHQLASYLGMAPATLSRIRKKVADGKAS